MLLGAIVALRHRARPRARTAIPGA
jgi:hypothetical protein